MAEALARLQGLRIAKAGVEAVIELAKREQRELTVAEMLTVQSQRVGENESFKDELERRRKEEEDGKR